MSTAPENLHWLGVCYYRLGKEKGTLDALFYSVKASEQALGTGHAYGNDGDGIEGRYVINYTGADGSAIDPSDLEITKVGSVYKLTWSVDGELQYVGTGIDVDNGVAFIYRENPDK